MQANWRKTWTKSVDECRDKVYDIFGYVDYALWNNNEPPENIAPDGMGSLELIFYEQK